MTRLLDVDPDNLVMEGDDVKVKDGDKTLKFDEYAAQQGDWFKRALFPGDTDSGDEGEADGEDTSTGTSDSESGPKAPPSKRKQGGGSRAREFQKRQGFGLVRPNVE
jgi:hypothetical protein